MIQFGYTTCPGCGADLDGGMIPVERRKLYGGVDRYSKLIYCAPGPDDPECLLCSGCMLEIPLREEEQYLVWLAYLGSRSL